MSVPHMSSASIAAPARSAVAVVLSWQPCSGLRQHLTQQLCAVLCYAMPCCMQDLSEAEVWQQHHSQVQQYQLEYERKAQLTKAVHAAIAYGKQLGYRPFSPTEPEQQHTAQQQRPPAPSEPQQQQDMQETHQLVASSMQDDVQTGLQQQQRDAEQQSVSLGQWHFAAGPSAVQESTTQVGGLHVSTDATGSQAASSSGSETTRSSGSTRGSYSDLEDEGAAAAGTTQQPTSNSAHVDEPVVVEAAEQQPCSNQHNAAATVAEGAEAAGAASDGDADVPVRWPSGPAWDVSDYEEEVRQLSDQLQVRGAGFGWSLGGFGVLKHTAGCVDVYQRMPWWWSVSRSGLTKVGCKLLGVWSLVLSVLASGAFDSAAANVHCDQASD